MSRHENRLDFHPDDDQLDRLRAGLLDGTPEHQGLMAHLAACETCRWRLHRWQVLVRAAFAEDGRDAQLYRALKDVRPDRLVAARTPRFFPPLALAATLAALAIGVASVLPPILRPATAPTQTAETHTPSPDLLADIDFYLWLSGYETKSPSPPDAS